MGTKGSLLVWGDGGERALAIAQEALQRVSTLMTPYAESDVTRINKGGRVRVAPETHEVIARAQAFSQMSGGLFDITFAALAGVWSFDAEKPLVLPDKQRIATLLKRVDYKQVRVGEQDVELLSKQTVISLNGIAKGYGVDKAVAALRASGVRNFILRLGGDLFAAGKPGDRKWKIGVRDPRGSGSFAELEVEDAAFSTSGDYERFAFADGVRYHHILDPRTGYPATASRAVSVLAPDCTTAEGLTKILFIAGKDDGYLKQYPGSQAIIVTATNNLIISEGLTRALHVMQSPTN